MNTTLKIEPNDNVVVALVGLKKGSSIRIGEKTLILTEDIEPKHKIALHDLNIGDSIYMYGIIIGCAIQTIPRGSCITVKNTVHKINSTIEKEEGWSWSAPNVEQWRKRTFDGYIRKDGQVGTRNVWLFFPLVFCENRNIERLKDIFQKELFVDENVQERALLSSLINKEPNVEIKSRLKKPVFENVEVKFITHQGGCGGTKEDSESLAHLLAGYVNNPNVVGASVLSLGCQHLQISIFETVLKSINPSLDKPILIFNQQTFGDNDRMMQAIIKDTFRGLQQANLIKRQPVPLSKITLGLECGGSDGFSGISANPLLGCVSDRLVALGGTPILSEFPELCGVEQELVNRCVDSSTAHRFLDLMRTYESSAEQVGSGFDMNPSPGNVKDGLITDAMKSAGAAKKGGSSPIEDVLDYGDYFSKPGLNLLCTPGNDVESTTAMVGSGANMIAFTTGLGTPTGNPIAPVVKVSTNSSLANRMADLIDFDAGGIIAMTHTLEELADAFMEELILIASGKKIVRAEQNGQEDFIPWKRGVSL
jgi:altronate hydrolase